MKYISSFFFGTNVIPLVIVYLSYIIYIYFRHSQFVVISLLYIIRLMLFTNPIIVIPFPSNSSYNETIYEMNRIRNNDDSCDISVWSFQKTTSVLSN